MIKLRRIEFKDIPFMLEWMHDVETKTIFQNDFSTINEDMAKKFVESSFTDENKHFAIVDDLDDEYLGTISLKNIDKKNKNAEYAISTRRKIWGTGISKEASILLLQYGFVDMHLNKIYLNVLSTNVRAKKFYKKLGFKYEGTFKQHLFINGEFQDLEWFGILEKDNF